MRQVLDCEIVEADRLLQITTAVKFLHDHVLSQIVVVKIRAR